MKGGTPDGVDVRTGNAGLRPTQLNLRIDKGRLMENTYGS